MELIKNDIDIFNKKNKEKINIPDFINSVSLNYKEFYNNSYNAVRRSKIILFNECLFNIDNDKKNIEKKTKLARYNTMFKIIDNILTKYTYNKKSISTILNYYSNIYYICNISKKLEISCLNNAITKANKYNIRPIWESEQFALLYHGICYRVSVNLDEYSIVKSGYLKNKILSNVFNIYNISSMTSSQLCPHKNQNIKKKIDKRSNIIINLKYSELYRCKKCKRNQTTTERRYNRSLDEGVNLTITCTFCGHQWNG